MNEAQRWLEENKFIAVEGRPGRPNRVTVLNETGDGSPYVPPGLAANRLRDTPGASEHYYVQIPSEMWTSGYMSRVTASGLALYLILLDQQWMNAAPEAVWFSPRVLKERYALSDDTRNKGMNDLRELGLITVQRKPVNPDDFDLQRIRNTYTLSPDALDRLPPPPAKRQIESGT